MNQSVDFNRSAPVTPPTRHILGFSRTPLLLRLLSQLAVGELLVTLPDGQKQRYVGRQAGVHADLTLHDWRACDAIVKRADIGFAESYRDGWLDSTDLLALLQLATANEAALSTAFSGKWYSKLLYVFKHWNNRNTKTNSKKNIHAHYDLGNDFYQLWLDPSMTYSSALFSEPDQSLESAQTAKYARLFEQLAVSAGDHVLEIGCGWGGFAEYAALRGVRVTGVSLSREQLTYAKQRLSKLGLSNLVDLRYQDYRDIRVKPGQAFDAIVSIEMIEAVGEAYWPSYFQQLHDLVKPSGQIALQAITIDEAYFDNYRASTDFIQQYIFPGGMLASPSRLRQEVEQVGLQWRDALAFGQDYAETLLRWRQMFEQNLEQIRVQGFDEGFIRLWRFYYVYCEAGFLSNRTSVYQLHLHKPALA